MPDYGGGGHHGMGGDTSGRGGQNGNKGNNQTSPGHPSQSYDPDKSSTVVGEPDKANLSKELVDKLAPETLKALLEGGHGISGSTYGKLSDDAKYNVDTAVAKISQDEAAAAYDTQQKLMEQAHLGAYGTLTPQETNNLSPQMAASLSMTQLSPQQRAALTQRGYDLSKLGYVPGLGIMGLQRQPTIRDITTGEVLGYPSEGLTGYAGMLADFLEIDTSGMNFGIDPEAEREATRGQEPLSTMELLYPTEGESLTEEEIAAAQDPILSGYDLNYIDSVDEIQPYTTFAAGGLASLPANFNPMTGVNPFRIMMRGGRI